MKDYTPANMLTNMLQDTTSILVLAGPVRTAGEVLLIIINVTHLALNVLNKPKHMKVGLLLYVVNCLKLTHSPNDAI